MRLIAGFTVPDRHALRGPQGPEREVDPYGGALSKEKTSPPCLMEQGGEAFPEPRSLIRPPDQGRHTTRRSWNGCGAPFSSTDHSTAGTEHTGRLTFPGDDFHT
jgi:hypothetical protein